jgi:hypothetical protein
LRPTPATLGVTPAVARQLNLPPTGPSAQRIAPGPSIHGAPFVTGGATPGPAIAGRALPPLHNPVSAPTAAAAAARPFVGAPALRTPPAPGQIAPPVIRHEAGAMPAIGHPQIQPGNLSGPPPGSIAHSVPLAAAPPPAIHYPPAPAASPAIAAPPTPGHVQPPMVAHVPPPALHTPPQVVHTPPVMVHAPAPPAPPQVHAAPPPAFHAPAPTQSAPHKRPGEP